MNPIVSDKELHRHTIAIFDFEQSRAFASKAQMHRIDTIEYEALLFAAIVSFVRPFSQNEKNNNSPATPALRLEHFDPLSDSERQLHEACVTLRNKALAHSEFELNPTRINKDTGVIASRSHSLVAQQLDISALLALTNKLCDECHHKRADYVRLETQKG